MPIVLNVTLESGSVKKDALQIVKAIKPNWDLDEVQHKAYTTGLTNKLHGFFSDKNSETLLVKVYGENTGEMIDRKKEIETMLLLQENVFGPKLYATFNNGICYEYIQGMVLTVESVKDPKIYAIVAKQMANMHSNVPTKSCDPKSEWWEKLRKFETLVVNILDKNSKLKAELEKFGHNISPSVWKQRIDNLQSILEKEEMPVVFCHNDLSLGNIIYDQSNSRLNFIDYEYASENYAPYEVANHFQEFAGPEADFSLIPDPDFRANWISEYLKHFNKDRLKISQQKFERWVTLCLPASHLFWTLFAIIQAHESTINFDFVGYFGLSYAEYEKRMKDAEAILRN